jgi:hypothetical protein
LKRIGALLFTFALVVAACSSQPTNPGAEGDGSRLGGSKSSGKDGKKDGKGDNSSSGANGQGQGNGSDGDGSRDPLATPSPPPGGAFVSHGPPSPVDPSLARKSAVVEEPQPDGEKEGLAPGYSEVMVASIDGLGDDVRFTLKFNGQVPDKMEDDKTYMVIGWAMSMGDEENYAFSARGSQEGWETFAAKRNEAPKFPGSFEIQGDSIVIQVPWTFLDGPRAFNWYASSSWFKSLAGTTHYLFDSVPNEEAGSFPN